MFNFSGVYSAEKIPQCEITQDSLVRHAIDDECRRRFSPIAKVSRLLRPVGPVLMSQKTSPGYHSHDPYRLQPC